MNRPSRSDDTADHPNWNQNPPPLAADLTTCQDLNGIANARQYRSGKGNGVDGDSGLGITDSLPFSETMTLIQGAHHRSHPLGQRSSSGSSCPFSKETVASGHTNLPVTAPSPLGRRSKAVLSWVTWTLSVIITSVLLNHLSIPNIFPLSALDPDVFLLDRSFMAASSSSSVVASPDVASPIFKRSSCGSGNQISEAEYNTPFHVGALIIILTVSTGACTFSMVMRNVPHFTIPPNFFFAVRHFGTGVLIATAFVHLLPTAFTYLGDPCLSSFWTKDYPAMPGAIALGGIFFVTLIEMVFSPRRHIHQITEKTTVLQGESILANDSAIDSEVEMKSTPTPARPRAPSAGGPIRDMGPLRGRSLSISRQLSRVSGRPNIDALTQHSSVTMHDMMNAESAHEGQAKLTPEQQQKKDILQCMLLEIGILFHSVFIGMAVSVSTGSEFIVLLIAIAFHQLFEGLALGARIAAIEWPKKSWQPWIMAFAYGCTTPIGQAIGLAVHSLYDPASELGLILVGTMNAISSGLLMFASLVELLSEDFLSDESWKVLRGKRRVVACLLVLSGAFGMSLVGAWA